MFIYSFFSLNMLFYIIWIKACVYIGSRIYCSKSITFPILKLCLSKKLLLSISPVIAASSNAASTFPRFLNRIAGFSVDYFLIQKVMNKH